jgi:hypothetical protein
VQVFGQDAGGFSTGRTMQETATSVPVRAGAQRSASATATNNPPRLVIDAQAGVGHVQVIRTGP